LELLLFDGCVGTTAAPIQRNLSTYILFVNDVSKEVEQDSDRRLRVMRQVHILW
jgi:hypothetical protein